MAPAAQVNYFPNKEIFMPQTQPLDTGGTMQATGAIKLCVRWHAEPLLPGHAIGDSRFGVDVVFCVDGPSFLR